MTVHMPDAGVVRQSCVRIFFLCCLVLLFALEALYVQHLAFPDNPDWRFQHRLIPNILLALALVLSPRLICRCAAVLQFALSVLIVSYIINLGSPPSMSAIYHGTSLLFGTGEVGFSYIPLSVAAVFTVTLAAKFFALRAVSFPASRMRTGAMLFCLLAFFAVALPRFIKTPLDLKNIPGDFRHPVAKEIFFNGYLLAWSKEILSGKYAAYASVFVRHGCDDTATRYLPDYAPGRHIALIQVESLDYSALSAEHQGFSVAPTLAGLAKDSLVLVMDGTKKLGSANSDFELLNSEVVTEDALYYAFRQEYPDSIISLLSSSGYDTMVFCGVNKHYMDMGSAYQKMGFNKLFFDEDLEQYGYMRREKMFMQQVPDADIFAMATEKIDTNNNILHFIITITMHGATGGKLTEKFSDITYYDTLNYFDSALKTYIDALDDGSMVIIYGDHRSYNGPDRDGRVPFIIYVKGERYAGPSFKRVFSRCELSHYLRRIFLKAEVAR